MRQDADPVHRVWLAFKGNRPTGEEIEVAIALALALRAELRGMMLHDEHLMALADLPFASEITATGKRRALRRPDLTRSLRVIGDRVHALIDRAVGDSGIDWSFETEGHALGTALARLEETEVLVLGGLGGHGVIRPALRARPASGKASVLCVFGETPAAVRGLRLAAGIASREGRPLVVCLVAGDLDREHLIQNRARALLAEAGVVVRYRAIARLEASGLGRIRREENAARVIVALDDQLEEAIGLCDRAPCSLILVR